MNTDDVIKLMEELEASTGASNIGAAGGTVQSVLAALEALKHSHSNQAVLDQIVTAPMKFWAGTLTEYNALTYDEKHDGSLHCIYEE